MPASDGSHGQLRPWAEWRRSSPASSAGIALGDSPRRVLLLGAEGGVGRAVLAALERTSPGRALAERFEHMVLVDRKRAERSHPPLPGARLLPPRELRSAGDLSALVREHGITDVLDLAPLDTVESVHACQEADVRYLCTSAEAWPGQRAISTGEAIGRVLGLPGEPLEQGSHLIGAGANPGIVNALVFAALQAFAHRVGCAPDAADLDLHGILITEEDTTTESTEPDSHDVFPMTWNPRHCLEELFEPNALAARSGRTVALPHAPTAHAYRARCGSSVIEGWVVPHEEVVTLARRFTSVEIAFVYRINPAARRALARDPDRRTIEAWRTRRLYPPETHDLRGEDRLGVLLCSRRFGELWLGFCTQVHAALALGTNATQLQVAAGVLAGFGQLGARRGVHFVEDLDWQAYLRTVIQVLGPPVVIHDAKAPQLALEERLATPLRRRSSARQSARARSMRGAR